MPSMRRSHLAGSAFASAILTVSAVAPGVGADAQDETSLCDLLSLGELHGLSDLRYGEPRFGSESFCFLESSPDQIGPHSVNVNVLDAPFGMTIEDFRAAQLESGVDIVDVSVGDLAGFIDASVPDTTSVIVGLDERILSVTVMVETSAEAGDLDPQAYAVRIAEIVVPRFAAGGGGPTIAPAFPQVEGIEWRAERETAGEQFETEANEFERQLVDTLIEASGASYEQTTLLNALAFSEADERLGTYLSVRITGADATALEPVFVEWLREASGTDPTTTETEIGGRRVLIMSAGAQRALIHALGETLYLMDLPDEIAATVLVALPE